MIEFQAVNYVINDKPILEHIDLTIAPHEFVAIIGPNGAGKSTLIKILLNIIPDYQGTVLIDGINHKEWLKTNRIGYLPQKEDFDRDFPATALDIVMMGKASQKGLFHPLNSADKAQARDYLDQVGIKHLADHQIGSLSGGEWQRTLLARALITGSQYLILDEPEAGIDKRGVTGFFDMLAELNKAGKTIITISHDLHTLNQYCTFLVCLNKTLHCHTETELITAEHIHMTFGDGVKLIEKDY